MTGKIIQYNNRLALILPVFFSAGFAFFLTVALFSLHIIIGIIASLLFVWLIFEMICNAIIIVEIESLTIRIRKPLRRRSFLSRKKHHELVIGYDEWDQLYVDTVKNGSRYYFRREQTVAYYFAADGLADFIYDLTKLFPEKKIMDQRPPLGVIKSLRKQFPERVL